MLDLFVIGIVGVISEMFATGVFIAVFQDIIELVLNVVCLAQGPEIEEVGLAELFGLLAFHPCIVHVQ